MDTIADQLLDREKIGGSLTYKTRSLMAQMLEAQKTPTSLKNHTFPTQSSQIISIFMELFARIYEELETHLERLLSLNPSRRDGILHYLNLLTGYSHSAFKKETLLGGLKGWIENPKTPQQEKALRCYLEETALVALSQAILLKVWSDKNQRKLETTDLGQLNWALNSSLRSLVPLNRDGWQITKPNLYSWYNPNPEIQAQLLESFLQIDLSQEGPHFLLTLVQACSTTQSEVNHPSGYDYRFYQSIWENISFFGFLDSLDSSCKREKVVFCPTLREASIIRTSLPGLKWIGMESSAFLFFMMELMELWNQPIHPPDWILGTGLEAHARTQLTFPLTTQKPFSVLNKIIEMEACDAAFVLEEEVTRPQSKNSLSSLYRTLLDQLPYFKKIRSSTTSLGTLQTCVAITKLRQGGLLWLAREEPLGSQEGTEALHFILNRSKLLYEWDLSRIEHKLPCLRPLFPRYLYLFQREIQLNDRSDHIPIRYSIQGKLRSHIELPVLLQDILLFGVQKIEPRGPWSIHRLPSLHPQKQWIEKWPDAASFQQIQQLDWLGQNSVPLAQIATLRCTPISSSKKNHHWMLSSSLQGFWISEGHSSFQEPHAIQTHSLPQPGEWVTQSGYLVLVSEKNWVPILQAYLQSPLVQLWLENHTEKKADRWVLHEQVLKCIPVPNTLITAFENYFKQNQPLPSSWKNFMTSPFHAREAKQQLQKNLSPSHPQFGIIHASLFIQASLHSALIQEQGKGHLSLLHLDGTLDWRQIITQMIPESERLNLTFHPKIQLSGHLPPHLPVVRMDKIQRTSILKLLLTTESGFALQIQSDSSFLLQLIWDQLQNLKHATWHELIQNVLLPKKLEVLESLAMATLKQQTEYLSQLEEVKDFLESCHLTPEPTLLSSLETS